MYAWVEQFPEHDRARVWLDERLGGPGRVGLPWPSLLAFVRLSSNRHVFERPFPPSRAWTQVEAWLDAPASWVPVATLQHRDVLGRMMAAVDRANDVPDAHLAALAVEHGLVLMTADRGFARFPDLRYEDPLAHGA